MKRIIISAVMTIATLVAIPSAAFAHVVVTPNAATVGSRVLFSISVPNEKEIAVTSVKLSIPSGLDNVQPNVLGGWDVTTAKDKDTVTSITWTGNIPAGQRADLLFKAQAPAKATELDWKAYQTYADGSVVSWDQKPTAVTSDDDSSAVGPYSVTNITDDTATASPSVSEGSSSLPILSIIVSVFAVLLSLIAILTRKRK